VKTAGVQQGYSLDVRFPLSYVLLPSQEGQVGRRGTDTVPEQANRLGLDRTDMVQEVLRTMEDPTWERDPAAQFWE
jgi:hypothetical protein